MGNRCGGKHLKRGSGNDLSRITSQLPETINNIEIVDDKSSITLQAEEEKRLKEILAEHRRHERIQLEKDEHEREIRRLEEEQQDGQVAEQFARALLLQHHRSVSIIQAFLLGKIQRVKYKHEKGRIIVLQSLARTLIHLNTKHGIIPDVIIEQSIEKHDTTIENVSVIVQNVKLQLEQQVLVIQAICYGHIVRIKLQHDYNMIVQVQSIIRSYIARKIHIYRINNDLSRIVQVQAICRRSLAIKKWSSMKRQNKREQIKKQMIMLEQQEKVAKKLAKNNIRYAKRRYIDIDIICVKKISPSLLLLLPSSSSSQVITPIQLKPLPNMLQSASTLKPLPFMSQSSPTKKHMLRRTDSMSGLLSNNSRIIDIKPITITDSLTVSPLKNFLDDGLKKNFMNNDQTKNGNLSKLVSPLSIIKEDTVMNSMNSPSIEVNMPKEEKKKEFKPYHLLCKKLRKRKNQHMIYFGSNSLFQFGFKDSKCTNMLRDNKALGVALNEWKIIKLSTWTNTLSLTDDYMVYGWGYNKGGELGMGHSKVVKGPHFIDVPRSRDISVGTDHTLVLTLSRQVYLGMNEVYTHLKEFDDKKIDKIFSGTNHYALVTLDGNMYLSPTVRPADPEIPKLSSIQDDMPSTPRTAEIRRQARQERIKSRQTKQDIASKYMITGISNVQSVALGESHIMVLDLNGNVWTWGNCRNGRLGHGDFRSTLKTTSKKIRHPMKITELKNIVQIAAGKDYSLALDRYGKVYSWGGNEFGQLGINSMMNMVRPQIIHSLLDQKIISIVCGEYHCMALNDKGMVYSWGKNEWSQLGIGESEEGVRIPVHISSLSGMFITGIGAGYIHSYVIGVKR